MLLEEFDVKKYERTLRKEGIEIGDAKRLVKSVEEILSKMDIPLSEACNLIGVTIEQYEEAKKYMED